MAFPSFSHEQPLPSLRVTKEFLASIERYLLKWVVDASLASEDEAPKLLSIEIEDGHGSETVTSISQVTGSRFADSTSRIQFTLETAYNRNGTDLRVKLCFSSTQIFSTLKIKATMPNARELSLGLKDSLLRILEPQKTWHWIVHPSSKIWHFLLALSLCISLLLFQANIKEPYSFLLIGFQILLSVYLFVMGSFRKYTIFDSRASERADKIWGKIWGWFIGGVATVIVFGFLTPWLLNRLAGP
jgi:hypothetical protein